MKFSTYLLLAGLGLIALHNSYASGATKTDIKTIMRTIEQNGAPANERSQLKMVIKDADGSKKERVISILRKTKGETKAMVRLLAPADLKGLSLLTVASGGHEDQWLYLPSDKKSRRILGSNKKGRFLDSDIAFEDLSISTYRMFNNKVVSETPKTIQIDSRLQPGSESTYSRIVTWISNPDYRLEKVEYYDRKGKLVKRAEFSGYTKIAGRFWRAKKMIVKNLIDKRVTSLTLQKTSVDEIRDDEISLSAMED